MCEALVTLAKILQNLKILSLIKVFTVLLHKLLHLMITLASQLSQLYFLIKCVKGPSISSLDCSILLINFSCEFVSITSICKRPLIIVVFWDCMSLKYCLIEMVIKKLLLCGGIIVLSLAVQSTGLRQGLFTAGSSRVQQGIGSAGSN